MASDFLNFFVAGSSSRPKPSMVYTPKTSMSPSSAKTIMVVCFLNIFPFHLKKSPSFIVTEYDARPSTMTFWALKIVDGNVWRMEAVDPRSGYNGLYAMGNQLCITFFTFYPVDNLLL